MPFFPEKLTSLIFLPLSFLDAVNTAGIYILSPTRSAKPPPSHKITCKHFATTDLLVLHACTGQSYRPYPTPTCSEREGRYF